MIKTLLLHISFLSVQNLFAETKKGDIKVQVKDGTSVTVPSAGVTANIPNETRLGKVLNKMAGRADSFALSDSRQSELIPKGVSTTIRFNLPKDPKSWKLFDLIKTPGLKTYSFAMPKDVKEGQPHCTVVINLSNGDLGSGLPQGKKPVRSIAAGSIAKESETGKKKKRENIVSYQQYLRAPVENSPEGSGFTFDRSVQHDIALLCGRIGKSPAKGFDLYDLESQLNSTGMSQYVDLDLKKLPTYQVPEEHKDDPAVTGSH